MGVIDNPESSLLDQIDGWAALAPERPALLSVGAAPWCYRDVRSVARDLVAQLAEYGLESAHRVALVMPGSPATVVALLGISSRSPCALFPPDIRSAEFEKACHAMGVDTVVFDVECEASRWAEEHGLGCLQVNLSAKAARVSGRAGASTADPMPAGLLFATLGIAGMPKIVPMPGSACVAAAEIVANTLELTPHDRCLNLSSLHYLPGQLTAVFAPLVSGGSAICVPEASHPDVLIRHKALAPTWTHGGPAQFARLAEASPEPARNLKLGFIHTSGSALTPLAQMAIEAVFGAPVIQSYAMTETGMIACNPRTARRYGTVGKPRQRLRVVIADNRDAASGEPGEIVVAGSAVMQGYLGDHGGVGQGGWFRTGDVGALDAEGYLSISGRLKELINRGGEKVFPAEIDAALEYHPAVQEAAAFAVPHPQLGEDIAAAVVLRPGHSVGETELRSFLGGLLSLFKIPRQIMVVESIPRNQAGQKLRSPLLEKLPGNFAFSPVSNEAKTWLELPPDELRPRLTVRVCEAVERYTGTRPAEDRDFLHHELNSVMLGNLRMELEETLGIPVPATTLFAHSTPAALAKALVQRLEEAPTARRTRFDTLDRPLSPSELCWVKAVDDAGTGVVMEGLRLRGPLTIDLLGKALAVLAERHPLLSVHLQGEQWKRQYVQEETIPIPLREHTLPVADLDSLVGHLLNRKAFAENAPLLEVHWVRCSDAANEHAVLLRAHQAIWDGGNRFARELWMLLADLRAGREVTTKPGEPIPPTDDLVKASASGHKHWMARFRLLWSLFRQQMPPLAKPLPTLSEMPEEWRTQILRRELSASEREHIEQVAAREGVTPLSLYTAAALRAIRKTIPGRRAKRLSVITTVDVRSHYDPPLSSDHLGCHSAPILNLYEVRSVGSLIELARDCRNRFTASLTQGLALDLFGFFVKLVRRGIKRPYLLGRSGRTVTLSIAMAEGFADFPRRAGAFEAVDFLYSTAIHNQGPSYALVFVPVPDGLRCIIHYPSPLITEKAANTMVKALLDDLRGLA